MIEPATKKRRRGSRTSKVLLFVLSLVFFMEGGARLVLWVPQVRKRMLAYDDSSFRLEWTRLHQAHPGFGTDDAPSIRAWTGQFAVYHPTRGWALKRDLKDMRVFDGKTLNANSKGLRGKTEYEYRRTPDKQRIVVLGDSYTFGSEVSDDETYSYYLGSSLPNTEVLNLGVQAYGHDQMLLYLKEEGVKYHPDVVIVGFAYLDVYRNLWTFFAYAKPKFKLLSGRLLLSNVPVPTPDHLLAEEPYRSKAGDLMVILRDKLRTKLGSQEREARELTRALLDEIVATTRSIGGVPVFVYLSVPSEWKESKRIPDSSENRIAISSLAAEHERFLYEYCQQKGTACLFLGPRFREEVNKGMDFNAAGHWNAQGHKLAAQEISDFLRQRNLIKNHSAF